jgi:hypothetical protein
MALRVVHGHVEGVRCTKISSRRTAIVITLATGSLGAVVACSVRLDPTVRVEASQNVMSPAGATGVPNTGSDDAGSDPEEQADASVPDGETDGPVLWLDATIPSSIEVIAGGVSVWRDVSGNDFSVSQSEASARPAIVEGAVGSNAVVRFDGLSHVLVGSVLEALENYDVFVVWRSPVAPPTDAQTHLLRSGSSLEVNHGHDQDAFRYAGASQFESLWRPAQFEVPTLDALYVWNLSFDSTARTLTAFTNGVTTTMTMDITGIPISDSEPLTIGSRWDLARHFTGDIGEVILYPRALTASERAAVQGYLDDKWLQ